jgi:thymidylate kinase
VIAAFIGIDGSGKSTQLRKLASVYAQRELDVRAVSLTDKANLQAALEIARTIGESPFQPKGHRIVSGTVLANALAADFLRHYVGNILPLVSASAARLILSDRYAVCYVAYAEALRAANDGVYSALGRICIPPDLTLWFDIPYDVVERRIAQRNEARAADETPEILNALIDYYRRTIVPNGRDTIRVPADLSEDEVTAFVKSAIDARLKDFGIGR